MEQIDIWRTASALVRQHGESARGQAKMRAGELLEQGARSGAVAMQMVADACQTLLSQAPTNADEAH